jgi:hypothetical protein
MSRISQSKKNITPTDSAIGIPLFADHFLSVYRVSVRFAIFLHGKTNPAKRRIYGLYSAAATDR